MFSKTKPIADEARIHGLLAGAIPEKGAVEQILERAKKLEGLDMKEVAALLKVEDPEQLQQLFRAARQVKENIYGKRLVFFAPLYTSNICANECTYCAFRKTNKELPRKRLGSEAIARETGSLLREGHKRVLLVASEDNRQSYFTDFLQAIDTVYAQRAGDHGIKRVNVNLAPLTVEQFAELKKHHIGTYQLFQETYHRATYSRVHPSGPKADFDWRLQVMDRAMEAGIDDVGLGALFGLYDWRFELLALLQHASHLERTFGVGPHTVSVPRMERAAGSPQSERPEYPVSDADFYKLIAVLRLALPYTGIILSTREPMHVRREALALGVSQISAGSATGPGGYSDDRAEQPGQFEMGDHRSLGEVVEDVARLGYVPSFCTACYRLGRTGRDFMDLAVPGEIKRHCGPNALTSFAEYLRSCPNETTRSVGVDAIERSLDEMSPRLKRRTRKMIARVDSGQCDVFC